LPGELLTAAAPGAVWVRQAAFFASLLENARPGESVRVPIYVNIEEGGSLSGLQFLARILPSAQAPALAGGAEFVPADGFPAGRSVDGLAPNQIAYAWDLGSFSPALEGRVLIGDVVFTVPVNARTGQSYVIRFGNADGAPDAETQYDFETFSARVWVGGKATELADGISDEWK
jgi:hypothetical protein